MIRWVPGGCLSEAAERDQRPASAQHLGERGFEGKDAQVVQGFHVTFADRAAADGDSGL
ncbi:hypothetical protein [Kibdelosporangium phytohabitans]|uniref:hypothetical protein n=1 Tax=Kibdelosporangium phytohabitans TaxID=860235 RepID=UPI0012F7300D|nr:hypothetical protein [Kibdelosporangium phytohabitans]MBE1465561.1 hypothetical protein [Kibdelosporangium phytohabitans]